jgi:hypothetical protein
VKRYIYNNLFGATKSHVEYFRLDHVVQCMHELNTHHMQMQKQHKYKIQLLHMSIKLKRDRLIIQRQKSKTISKKVFVRATHRATDQNKP